MGGGGSGEDLEDRRGGARASATWMPAGPQSTKRAARRLRREENRPPPPPPPASAALPEPRHRPLDVDRSMPLAGEHVERRDVARRVPDGGGRIGGRRGGRGRRSAIPPSSNANRGRGRGRHRDEDVLGLEQATHRREPWSSARGRRRRRRRRGRAGVGGRGGRRGGGGGRPARPSPAPPPPVSRQRSVPRHQEVAHRRRHQAGDEPHQVVVHVPGKAQRRRGVGHHRRRERVGPSELREGR